MFNITLNTLVLSYLFHISVYGAIIIDFVSKDHIWKCLITDQESDDSLKYIGLFDDLDITFAEWGGPAPYETTAGTLWWLL